MKNKIKKSAFVFFATAVISCQSSQEFLKPKNESQSPITAHPNFNGIWQSIGSANYDLEDHEPRAALVFDDEGDTPNKPHPAVLALGAIGAVPGGEGVIEGGQIPYRTEALKKRNENRRLWLERDPEIKCYQPGIPRAQYMPFPFQIIQNENKMIFVYEYAGAVRDISFEPLPELSVGSWMGQSLGSWRGNSLEIVTTGFNGKAWLDRAGNHHSDQLKVTERFQLIDENTISYTAVLEDPVTYEKPWKIQLPLYRRREPQLQLGQFQCVEFVEELMYGKLRKKKK